MLSVVLVVQMKTNACFTCMCDDGTKLSVQKLLHLVSQQIQSNETYKYIHTQGIRRVEEIVRY